MLVIVVVRTFIASELLDRVTFSGGGGTSIEDDPRMRIWAAGIRAFQRNPLLGVGDGAYATATAEGGKPAPSHNTFVCLLAEVGIAGTALYLVYLAMLFRSALRLPWREKVFWLGIMMVSMCNAVTCGSLIDRFTWSLYTLLLVQEVMFRGASASRSRKPLPRGALDGPLPHPCVRIHETLDDRFDDAVISNCRALVPSCDPRNRASLFETAAGRLQ